MNIVKDEHIDVLKEWHEDLQDLRGQRAGLRRSNTVNEACLSEGFRSLLMRTHTLWNIAGEEWRFSALALTAALAAHVQKIIERPTFAAQLGQKNGSNPVMSTLRFSRMTAVKTPDDLLRQLRRAVKLLKGEVNLPSLAEDIFRWCRENDDRLNHFHRALQPTEFIKIRWALDYYQAGESENAQ